MKRSVSALKPLYSGRGDASPDELLKEYIRNGRKPWSPGYDLFRWDFVQRALSDTSLLEKFYRCSPLPKGYGEFLDERSVEYPWLFSRLNGIEGKLLDAGSILNHSNLINHNALSGKKLFLLTLAPEGNCFWSQGVSYIFSDIRDLPFKDNFFDIVISISTLEHVGMDNTMIYTSEHKFKEDARRDFVIAAKELRRVLKPGSKCFITVPFGRFQYDVFQQQFDSEMVDGLRDAFEPATFTEVYYKYSGGGWNISTREECIECKYFNIHKTKYFDKNSVLDYDEDFAAAARAVAALELIK